MIRGLLPVPRALTYTRPTTSHYRISIRPPTMNSILSVRGRRAKACGLLLSILVLTGCANHGAALIKTIPEGVEVVNLADDTVLGLTPVTVWWREGTEKRKFVNIRLQKVGYRDKTSSFWVTLRHGSKDSALAEPQFVEIKMDKADE